MLKMYMFDEDNNENYYDDGNEPIEFFIISEIIYAIKIVSSNY